jgi:hypothetical protein
MKACSCDNIITTVTMSPQHLGRYVLRSMQGATLLRSRASSSYAGRISRHAPVTSTMIPTWSRRAMTHEASLKAPLHEAQNAFPPLKEFDLRGRVFVVTGGGRGLGLSMAEALMEAGGKGGPQLLPIALDLVC